MSARKSVQDIENTGHSATKIGADCWERATEVSGEASETNVGAAAALGATGASSRRATANMKHYNMAVNLTVK